MSYSFNKILNNVVPMGVYKAIITDVKFLTGTSGEASGNMAITLTISEGPQAKKTLRDTIYEKAMSFRLKPFLVATGVDVSREFSTAQELFDYGITEAKGKSVMIEVAIRTYEGKEYNDIKNYLPIVTSTSTPTDVLSEFAQPDVQMVGINTVPEGIQKDVEAPTIDFNLDEDAI